MFVALTAAMLAAAAAAQREAARLAVRNHHIPVNLLPTCPSQRHRCLMILSVRAMSPRAAWAANASASLPFVTRIVILRHSNWKNNYR